MNPAQVTEKWCSNCRTKKPLSDFNKNRHKPTKHQDWCRDCHQKIALKGRAKDLGMKWLPQASPEMLFEFQQGRCYICGALENGRKHHRDHNHITGWLRGILCADCNHRLPTEHIDEDLARAERYLLARNYKPDVFRIIMSYLTDPPYFQLLRKMNVKY